MELVIHRGTDEIGASCVEVRGAGRRIFLDAGLPLDDALDAPVCLLSSLPEGLSGSDALFISHSHLDHCGLLEQVPENILVYMSETARQLLDASRMFSRKPLLNRPIQPLTPGNEVRVGGLVVTPRLMDHSAPDALGFHVQADGRGIFYTGDFRSHGRKGKAFEHLLQHPPKPLDALLMEGTLLDRSNATFPDETSVEEAMVQAFRNEPGLSCVVCSGQNIDRLVSVYRATRKAGRDLVLDLYTAWVLEVFGRTHASTPRMEWDGVRVLAHGCWASRHYGVISNAPDFFGDFRQRVYAPGVAIRPEELTARPGSFVIKTSCPLALVEDFKSASVTTVYSLWAGNLDPNRRKREAEAYTALEARPGSRLLRIHTSGHADLETLRRLNEALRPKVLIPMHTEHKQRFPDHFPNVLVLEDGQVHTL